MPYVRTNFPVLSTFSVTTPPYPAETEYDRVWFELSLIENSLSAPNSQGTLEISGLSADTVTAVDTGTLPPGTSIRAADMLSRCVAGRSRLRLLP